MTKPKDSAEARRLLSLGHTIWETHIATGISESAVAWISRGMPNRPKKTGGGGCRPPAPRNNPRLDAWEVAVPHDDTLWSYGKYAEFASIPPGEIRTAITCVNALLTAGRVRCCFPGAFQWIPPKERMDSTARRISRIPEKNNRWFSPGCLPPEQPKLFEEDPE